MRARRPLIALSTLALLAALGGGAYLRIKSKSASKADGSGTPGSVVAGRDSSSGVAIPVKGAAVIRDTLVISVTATGQAAATRLTTLYAEVAGRVERVLPREGDAVPEGALLVALDSTQYALELASARAELRRAEATYRELTLFDDKITDDSLRRARAEAARDKSGLESTEIRLRTATLNLARVRVAAPFAGVAADVKTAPGQLVKPGDALVTVQRLDPIKVEVRVLEGEVGLLAPGRRASVTFAAFPGETFLGAIETINPSVDPTTRTARVTVAVPNPRGRILPGMYARVSLAAQRFANRVLVPRAAVLERDRRPMLFVLEGESGQEVAMWRYVTTGLANDSLMEIIPTSEHPGVKPGEVVLTEGHVTLTHQARVQLLRSENDAPAGRRIR